MTTLRLKPFTRLSKSVLPKCGVIRSCSRFSTHSLHQLRHPAPAPSSSRFLPRFLDPSIYWSASSRSKWASKSKVPKENKQWNPATFYVVIFLLIGSQAIQIIALKLDHEDRMRRANVKIAVLKEVIDRLYRGEEVDVEAMLGVGNEEDEKSWEEVLKEIEEEDAIWQAKTRKKHQKQALAESSENADSVLPKRLEGEKAELDKPVQQSQQPRSAQDYRFS